MEKIFEKEVEEILKAGEKKYLTTTHKKLPTLVGVKHHGIIIRVNTISKDDDLLVDYLYNLNKIPFSSKSSIFQYGQHVTASKLAQDIDAIRPSRLVEIFIFRISEFSWRFNIRKSPFYVKKA